MTDAYTTHTTQAKTRKHISQAAIDAWLAGDIWGLADALGLQPWEYGVFPPDYAHAYSLPEENDNARSWSKCKVYQQQLIELAGLPPVSVKVATCKKRLEDAESRLAYLKTDMARHMTANRSKSEELHRDRIRDGEERVASLKARLEELECVST